MNAATSLFPHEKVRDEQIKLLNDVHDAVSKGKCLIANAPTGLGKTAASLAPALEYALGKGMTVFFLTSRHTQHMLALETLKQIRTKYPKARFTVTDIVGKKHMCAQDGADGLSNRQFYDYCKALRESNQCRFYTNLRKGGTLSEGTNSVVDALKKEPTHTEMTVQIAKQHGVCPYETAAIASQDATVIISDYYYVFNQRIRAGFLKKTGKKIEDSIIIIDEGHNLPERMREMLSDTITSFTIERAVKEAEKYAGDTEKQFMADLRKSFNALASSLETERIIRKEQLLEGLENYDTETVLEKLEMIAEEIRETQKQSSIGSVADFISIWQEGKEEGFARIMSRKLGSRSPVISLSYRCLDPGSQARELLSQAHSAILMSGTLAPTTMYREILGFPEGTIEREYKNPFPPANRLSLIITGVTTKFSERNTEQYRKIGEICIKSSDEIPGNVAIFFPSYSILNEVHKHIHGNTQKNIFVEHPNISKEEKTGLLKNFKMSYLRGGLLLAVIGGNFNEGIDLPGEFLNGVLIVGLPLAQPDLETAQIVEYYDKKFGKGWDYGYVFPAFTKAMQSAGRCIRSETDRGAVLFIDERYIWPRYYRCFPKGMSPRTTQFYLDGIREFFSKK
ncbi:ATP-dependent DNA helicase [Candidatus Woesearchaeota archaeon]|nr:ATP-dependent DNA helicase [Candidatus Woesearchaeota archaeon]